MDPNGPTRPVGPPARRHLEDATNDVQPLATPFVETDPSDVAGVDTPPVLPYLTPDAMLVYCQSRLTGINTQCREIMTRQEKNAKDQAALGELLSTLYLHQEGGKPDDIKAAYTKAIDEVGGPNTALGKQLVEDRDSISQNGTEKNGMESLINATKSHASKLNSDAEIDMIHLQSLMSQRQTAIQLTTNIVQSLNDQANKIVANIGH
jgi:hypothetical protein